MRLVVNFFHLDEKRNHRQVGVDALAGARMSCPPAGDGFEAVRPLVRVDDFEPRRLADDSVRVPVDHFSIQARTLRDRGSTAVTDLLVRRCR